MTRRQLIVLMIAATTLGPVLYGSEPKKIETENPKNAAQRLKCILGTAAREIIKKIHGDEAIKAYDGARERIKKLNLEYELCYHKKNDVVVVLNSHNAQNTDIESTVNLNQWQRYKLFSSEPLSSGEKTLKITKMPHEILERHWPPFWETEYFQRGHPIRETLFEPKSTSQAPTEGISQPPVRSEYGSWHALPQFGGGLKDKD